MTVRRSQLREGGAIGKKFYTVETILYLMDSTEDPEIAHEDFLYLVTNVACDIVYFGPKATPDHICDYLNDWRP